MDGYNVLLWKVSTSVNSVCVKLQPDLICAVFLARFFEFRLSI